MGTDFKERGLDVAKSDLGTKRVDPETGRKFYDLNKDPIVSPYTGKQYARSYFETTVEKPVVEEEDEVEEKEIDAEEDAPEVISLEEADEDVKAGDDLPDLEDDDVDLGDDDDTFLEDEEEEDDDVADIIGVGDDDDEI
jgi:uncharacterized protein (TIGR02300 family)